MKKMKLKRPSKVTINDCLLAYQMGYMAVVQNGQVKLFEQEKKRFAFAEACKRLPKSLYRLYNNLLNK